MKHYKYNTKIKPTKEQLIYSITNAWISYSENKQKNTLKSTNFVKWKCLSCSTTIRIHYKNKSLRLLYCNKCRPKIVRKNSVLLRYQIMFKNHINARIIKNTKTINI